MDDVGMVTSSRDPMKGKTLFYDFRASLEGPPSTTDRYRVPLNEAFSGRPGYDDPVSNQDSVTSFRTGTDFSVADQLKLLEKESNPLLKRDTGHEFDLRKYYVHNPSQRYVDLRGTYGGGGNALWHWKYRGPVGLYGTNGSSSGFAGEGSHGYIVGENENVDISMGAKAIAAIAPTKSEANVASSLLELKDGFPKSLGKSLRDGRDASAVGDEYLNFVFGWLPTISDVRDIARAMINAQKIITQYERDADRIVRRRFGFPVTNRHNYVSGSGINWKVLPSPFGPTNQLFGRLGNGNGFEIEDGNYNISLAVHHETRVWFSGAFRYHLNVGDDVFSRIDRTGQIAAKWLGARLDARAFWQAMPWSWFIDWFTDVGAIVDNATAASLDGQLLQWGYLMRHDVHRKTFMTDSTVSYDDGINPRVGIGNLATTWVSERKQRVKATPFGFGFDPGTFSVQQWAILGALGMTRAPNKLW